MRLETIKIIDGGLLKRKSSACFAIFRHMSELKKKSTMRNIRAFCIALGIAFQVCFFSLSPAYGYNDTQKELKTYVVYDDIYMEGDDYPYGRLLVEYLGHFNVSINEMPIAKWTPGSIAGADLVVYIGLNQYDISQKLLAEMANAKRVIWFGNNVDQMSRYLKWNDFQIGLNTSGWVNIDLNNKRFSFDNKEYVRFTSPGQKAEILATVSNAETKQPLAWKRDNIYFCGFLNFDINNSYILANLLHKFIPNNHTHSRSAFMRVEDVNPRTSPEALKGVIDVIKQHNIPFSIGVVPASAKSDGSLILLSERPALLKVLQDAQNNGGSIIMHGYTHQNIYSPKTGEGYEFWNALDDKPMEDDENFTRERLQKGAEELVRCGLIPLAFEPPHYAMSKTAYNVLSEHFNIFSGQIQLSDERAIVAGQLPYIVKSTYLNGMLIIPENLDYYDGDEFTVEALLARAKSITKVQDGVAGLFFHGYLPSAPLDSILTSMKEMNFEFLDLRQFPIKVQFEQITITGEKGKIKVDVDKQLKASWKESSSKLYWVIFAFSILFAIVVFAVISIRRRTSFSARKKSSRKNRG